MSAHVRDRGQRRDGSTKWQARYRHPSADNPTQPDRSGKWVEKTFRKKFQAEKWLRLELAAIEAGTWQGAQRRTGVSFAEAADEWLRYQQHDKGQKPSTVAGHRMVVERYLKPEFGPDPIERITTERIQAWVDNLRPVQRTAPLAGRSHNKVVSALRGIFDRAKKKYGLRQNPVVGIERRPERTKMDIEWYSVDEVLALVRAAEAGAHRRTHTPAGGVYMTEAAQRQRATEDAMDAAIYLTAAFTGLRRGELLALRWRDVDFPGDTIRVARSYFGGAVTTPKSGKGRAVPMAPQVAPVLARLGQRERHTGDDDLVFTLDGSFLDGSALRRRYEKTVAAAGLRRLRFHDLRHTFGSLAIKQADIVQLQAWMGHSDVRTTERYLHHKPRHADAALLGKAFEPETTEVAYVASM